MNTIFTITLIAATLLIFLAMIVGNIFLCTAAMSAYFLASAALYVYNRNKATNK